MEDGSAQSAFAIFPKNYDFQFAATCARQQRGSGGKYAAGQPLMMYQDKAWGQTGRDGLYFEGEWKAEGGRRSALNWSSPSLVDCQAWYWDQYLKHNVYDGIYLDDAFPTATYNCETGSAYRLPDGRVQPGTSFFGFREYLKRVWCLFDIHGKRPIVTVHATSSLMLPALSFATSIYDGEDTTRMGKYDFLEVWPMERFQVLDDPYRTGLITMFMFKGGYAAKYPRDPLSQSRVYRAVWTAWLLHDLWYGGAYATVADQAGKQHGALQVLRRYAGPDTVFHPYYRNGDRVKVESLLAEPLPKDQLPRTWFRSYWSEEYIEDLTKNPLKASVYQKSRQLLLAVGNYADTPVKGRVVLKLNALGIPESRTGAVKASDVDDWPLKESSADAMQYAEGVVACTVPARSFRLIELTW